MMTWFVVVVGIAGTSLPQLSSSKTERNCSLNSYGDHGVCVPLTECTELWHRVKHKNDTVFCGIDGQVLLVCCGSKSNMSLSEPALALTFDSHSFGSSKPDIPKSQRKCQEYSKLVYEGEESKADQCSIRPDGIKVGRASLGEFPHAASLVYENEYNLTVNLCGGSLISERFVLTAAHCLSAPNKRLKWVLLGAVDLANRSTGQLIHIAQKIPHPDFRPRVKYFDVGLIQLQTTPILGPLLRPACLPSQDENFSSRRLIVIGWGAIAFGSTQSTDLLKTVIVETPYHVCARAYGINRHLRLGIHDGSMLCAAKPTGGGSGTCQGDSGAPIQTISTNHHCMYVLAGVTSFGIGCGDQNYPDVYTRLHYYRSWVENIVWP